MPNRSSRHVRLTVAALLLAACGTEPGSVIIALDGTPNVTTATEVTLTGSLTRSPPASTPLFVTVTGGAVTAVDTADQAGRFSLRVQLVVNQVNALTLTPEDGTGSSGQPANVEIRQDAMPPSVALMTPSGDAVSTATPTVVAQLTEAVTLSGPGAGMQLFAGSQEILGTSVIATDSLSFTFFPSGALPENAVIFAEFPGVTDVAGLPLTRGTGGCFVTELTVPAMDLFPDSTVDDVFGLQAQGGPAPAFTDPGDLDQIRTAIQDSMLSIVMRFTTPRSFELDDDNNQLALIEIDIDQDPNTGVLSVRDSILKNIGETTSLTGMGVEYVLLVDRLTQVADSGAVGEYVGFNSINVVSALWPGFCGRFVGIRVPLTLMGNDDGNLDIGLLALTLEGQGILDPFIVDLAPESGPFSLQYAGLFTPPPLRVAPPPRYLEGIQVLRIPIVRLAR